MGMTSCRPERRNPVSRPHQPGQDVFRSVLPDDIDWKPFAAFPPPARLAVVVGQPTEPGPYVIRVKVPSGVKLMPHRHPEDRVYTVISGVFYIGLGDEFDGDDVTAYPPGSVVVLPGGTSHFHWAKSGEYVTQVTAIGPLGLEYVDPEDRPAGATSVGSVPARESVGLAVPALSQLRGTCPGPRGDHISTSGGINHDH